MIKDYYSAQEIAEITGMSKAGILKKATRENWRNRPRKGQGGGKEFHIDSLPKEARSILAKQAAECVMESDTKTVCARVAKTLKITDALNASNATKNREKAMSAIAHLTGNAKLRAESKLILLGMWQTYCKQSTLGKTNASHEFLMLWREDALNIPAYQRWIREYINESVYVQTLYSWEKALETNPSRIWGNYGHRKGSGKIDSNENLKNFIIATIFEYPHIYMTQLYEAIETRFSGEELPSKRSVERWVNKYREDNAQVLAAITHPDKWKNKYMPAFGTVGVSALNEKWELDSTPADVMLTDGRYNILGAIDVYSKRPRLLVSKTSTAGSVAKLIRDCLLDWGVPQIIKTDNGADYVSSQIKTAISVLGITQDISAPFSPWEKPHIERFFRTFSHGLLELAPGFIGHNVSDRSAIEDRKQFSDRLFKKGEVIDINMSSEQLQKFADDWINHMYMHNEHSGESMNGKTPFQMVSEWSATIEKVQDERALDILLAPVGERTVAKDGIRLDNFTYIAAELGPLVGEKVTIRKDPHDVGTIHVFQDGEFICIAEDTRYVGISRQEIAHKGKQNSLKNIAEAKKAIRSMKSKQNVKGLAEEILEAKRQENNVTLLPKKEKTYSNEHIESAIEAADMLSAEPLKIEQPKKPKLAAVASTPEDVYRRWLRLEQRIQAGEKLEQKDLNWFKNYQQTAEFNAMKEFFEEFGLGLEAGQGQ